MWQMPYSPCPPVCLTLRPEALGLAARPSPAAAPAASTVSTATPYRLRQPVEQHVGVRLAHAPQHELVGLGVVLQPQRRVLGDQPGQGLGQLVLVGLGLGHDRHRQQRLGHRPRLHQQRVVLVRQRVAGLGGAELGHRADVAGRALRSAAAAACPAARSARRSARRRRGRRARAGAAVPGHVHRRRPAAACRRTPGPG